MLLSRGTSTGWRNGLTGASRISTSRIAKSWAWGGTTPGTSICWGPPSWKAAWQKRDWCSWWTPSCASASNVPFCHKEGEWCLGLHWKWYCQQVEGGGPSPLLRTGEAIPEVLHAVLSSSVQEGRGDTGESPTKGHKDDEGSGASLLCGKSERAETLA